MNWLTQYEPSSLLWQRGLEASITDSYYEDPQARSEININLFCSPEEMVNGICPYECKWCLQGCDPKHCGTCGSDKYGPCRTFDESSPYSWKSCFDNIINDRKRCYYRCLNFCNGDFSHAPSMSPFIETDVPSLTESDSPSDAPSTSEPTSSPTQTPSRGKSDSPSISHQPSAKPTRKHSPSPSTVPTAKQQESSAEVAYSAEGYAVSSENANINCLENRQDKDYFQIAEADTEAFCMIPRFPNKSNSIITIGPCRQDEPSHYWKIDSDGRLRNLADESRCMTKITRGRLQLRDCEKAKAKSNVFSINKLTKYMHFGLNPKKIVVWFKRDNGERYEVIVPKRKDDPRYKSIQDETKYTWTVASCQ